VDLEKFIDETMNIQSILKKRKDSFPDNLKEKNEVIDVSSNGKKSAEKDVRKYSTELSGTLRLIEKKDFQVGLFFWRFSFRIDDIFV
jgi:hypothetical protein